ncbi:MAG TPA: TonB-dependent receptor [Allosphingosinicella sp.]
MIRSTLLAGAAAAALHFPAPVLAQDVQVPAPSEGEAPVGPVTAEPMDDPQLEGAEIVVTGFKRSVDEVLAGTSVVSGLELARDVRPTIGETLARQPGVSATSFGPNASRPVLRGFQGERIRILTDGIGSLDASNTSVDHAVAINPLTADRIEVLRGPSALLFGSAAIGGVVNVIDARIPRRVPDEGVHVEGIATYGSAADERSANAALDIPIGSQFVLHADANYSKTRDLEIGGFILSPELRAEALASADPDIQALAGLRGRLPNSGGRTSDIAAGVAWINGNNNAGISISRLDSLYAIPIRYPLDPAAEAEAVRIDLKQTRADGRAEVDAGDGFVDQVRIRGGYSDYEHSELDDTGAVGTTFFNKGHEVRIEAVQSEKGGWGGGFGAQYFGRSLETVGDEKSLPPNRTSQLGLFTVQTYETGKLRAEAGARYEHQKVSADADATLGNSDLTRSFDSFSGSAGASFGSRAFRVGVNFSHTERSPSAEELYVNGPHPGTQSFEIGNPDFSKEKSNGIELTARASGDGWSFGASAFHIWFDDYIYEAATGAIQDDLPVFEYRQGDARYTGFEVEGSVRVGKIGGMTINLDALADHVRATVKNVGPAPRIPPLRLLGGIEIQSDAVNGRIEVEHVTAQDRLAAFETRTGGHTLVNASVSIQPIRDHEEVSVTLSANNIFDVDARRHASFLKDFAPLAGRDLRVTARMAF